jgi:hypothetical protein
MYLLQVAAPPIHHSPTNNTNTSSKSTFKIGSFFQKRPSASPPPHSSTNNNHNNNGNGHGDAMDRKTLEKKLNDKLNSDMRGTPPAYVKSSDARKTALFGQQQPEKSSGMWL